MADSETPVETVDVTDDLDTFSDTFFNKTPEPAKVEGDEKAEVKVEETPEIETPSATEVSSGSEEPTPEADGLAHENDGEDEEVEGDKTPTFKIKTRKSARERITELNAKYRETERRLEEAIAKLNERERQEPSAKAPRTATPSKLEEGAPDPDATGADGNLLYPLGEFDPTFIRDLTRFTIKNETETARAREIEERKADEIKTAEQELLSSWDSKIKKSVKELPDLQTKVAVLEDEFVSLDPNYGKFLASTIMSLDYGPHVLDYLADHPEEARAIVASGPTRATIALGRLEARFVSSDDNKRDEVEKGKVVTSAPTPPPRNKGSAAAISVADDTDDLDAFEKKFFAKKK